LDNLCCSTIAFYLFWFAGVDMGRVFTMTFDFKDERHVAMVTVYNEHTDNESFTVRLFNETLHQIIPGGKIYFTSTNNSLPNVEQHPWAAELNGCIQQALSVHLMKKETVEESTLKKDVHDSDTNTFVP
jgi:hypothetical protein